MSNTTFNLLLIAVVVAAIGYRSFNQPEVTTPKVTQPAPAVTPSPVAAEVPPPPPAESVPAQDQPVDSQAAPTEVQAGPQPSQIVERIPLPKKDPPVPAAPVKITFEAPEPVPVYFPEIQNLTPQEKIQMLKAVVGHYRSKLDKIYKDKSLFDYDANDTKVGTLLEDSSEYLTDPEAFEKTYVTTPSFVSDIKGFLQEVEKIRKDGNEQFLKNQKR